MVYGYRVRVNSNKTAETQILLDDDVWHLVSIDRLRKQEDQMGELTIDSSHHKPYLCGVCRAGEMCVDLLCLVLV
jgi:hypothetical protein